MRGELWLEGCLGFEPRLAVSKGRFAAKMRHSGEAAMPGKSADRALSCVLHPGICLTTEGKSTGKKNPIQGSRKVPSGHDSMCRHGRRLG